MKDSPEADVVVVVGWAVDDSAVDLVSVVVVLPGADVVVVAVACCAVVVVCCAVVGGNDVVVVVPETISFLNCVHVQFHSLIGGTHTISDKGTVRPKTYLSHEFRM